MPTMIEKRTAIEQLRALLNPWKRAIDDAERAIDVDGSDVGTYPEGWDSEIVCLDIEASTCAIIAYAESLRDDGLIEFIEDIAQPAPNAGVTV